MKRGVIAIDEIPWNLEPPSEDVRLSINPDETNARNGSLGEMLKPWDKD